MFCSAKSRKLVFLAKTTVILLYIHLRQWLVITATWEDLPAVVFMSKKITMSSCVICLVIARESFLIKSDCSAITKVHNKFKNNNKNVNFTFNCC